MNQPTNPPLLLHVLLGVVSLLCIGLAVALFWPSGPSEQEAKKTASELMQEIEDLEASVRALEDSTSVQSLELVSKDKQLVDKYLELELMIRWVNKLEASGEQKADSIRLLKTRIEALRGKILSQRLADEAEKLSQFEALARENDSLRKLVSELAGEDELVNTSPALLGTSSMKFVNVAANGKEEAGDTFSRRRLYRVNVCFQLDPSSTFLEPQQVYLVYENPDGSIRNAAQNPQAEVNGEPFSYTNVALITPERREGEICVPVFENEDEPYQEGPQYVYLYQEGEVIGRGYFLVE